MSPTERALVEALREASREVCVLAKAGMPRLGRRWPLHGGNFETCKFVSCIKRRILLQSLEEQAKQALGGER